MAQNNNSVNAFKINSSDNIKLRSDNKTFLSSALEVKGGAYVKKDLFVNGNIITGEDGIIHNYSNDSIKINRNTGKKIIRRILKENNDNQDNVFIGSDSGISNTTGDSNTFIGSQTGVSNTTAGGNTFIGTGSGQSNTTGETNTAVGCESLLANTTGEYNLTVGADSMSKNLSGSYNTAVGTSSLQSLTSGDYNICLGNSAGDDMVNGTNQILIGNGCKSKGEDDTMVIGGNGILSDSKIITKWYPGKTDTTDLGSETVKFKNLYVNNIYASSLVGNISVGGNIFVSGSDNDIVCVNGNIISENGYVKTNNISSFGSEGAINITNALNLNSNGITNTGALSGVTDIDGTGDLTINSERHIILHNIPTSDPNVEGALYRDEGGALKISL